MKGGGAVWFLTETKFRFFQVKFKIPKSLLGNSFQNIHT